MRYKWAWLGVIWLVGLGCAGPAKTGVDLKSKAVSLNEAGYDYYRQSRFNLAQEKFAQALKYNRLIDRRVGIASNLNNLGVIAQEQGDLDRAVAYFQEALALNRESGRPRGPQRDFEQPGGGLPGDQGAWTRRRTPSRKPWDWRASFPRGRSWRCR